MHRFARLSDERWNVNSEIPPKLKEDRELRRSLIQVKVKLLVFPVPLRGVSSENYSRIGSTLVHRKTTVLKL